MGAATALLLSAHADAAALLARQCGAFGIVTYDPVKVVPSVIESVADWDALSDAVEGGAATEGLTVRLACDVGPVATTVGTAKHPFAGVFDGGSNTLTVALSGAGECVAPFARIAGATIRDLRVAGTVAGGMHCSGLVGAVDGGASNLVEGCEVAAAISSSGSHFGGFVGHGGSATATLRGCVFSGSLSGGTCVATFHGWSDEGAATTLVDCLDASASTHPIGRGADAVCVSNTCYLASKDFGNGGRLWSEGKRGGRAYRVTWDEVVDPGFDEPLRTYAGSGLAAYPAGLARGGALYAEAGAQVTLSPVFTGTPPAGKKHDAFAASAGELTQNGGAWVLAMPAGDVVVSATFKETYTDPEGREIADLAVVEWLEGYGFTQGDIDAFGDGTAATDKLYECYLLNCDFTAENPGGAISITGFAVSTNEVSVTVRLVRQSPLGFINGVLHLYGAGDLAAGFNIDPIAEEIIDFGDGDPLFYIDPDTDIDPDTGLATQTVTATFDTSVVTERFFNAAIEFPSPQEPDDPWEPESEQEEEE